MVEFENAAQRRLWFLERLLENMDAEKALDLAARMEAFVTTGGEATIPQDDHRHPGAEAASAQLPAEQGEATVRSLGHGSPGAECRPIASLTRAGTGGRLLNDAEVHTFTNRAAQGATNRELARVFGLTPRQAN